MWCCGISNTYVLLLAYNIFISLYIVIPHFFAWWKAKRKMNDLYFSTSFYNKICDVDEMEQSSKNKNRIIENETWNDFMNAMVIEE